MSADIKLGDCVKIPDGRIARVRKKSKDAYKVRVRRKTGNRIKSSNLKKKRS